MGITPFQLCHEETIGVAVQRGWNGVGMFRTSEGNAESRRRKSVVRGLRPGQGKSAGLELSVSVLS
jgi:hypothetical protein